MLQKRARTGLRGSEVERMVLVVDQRRVQAEIADRVSAAIESRPVALADVAEAAGISVNEMDARLRAEVPFMPRELIAVAASLCVPWISFLEGVQA